MKRWLKFPVSCAEGSLGRSVIIGMALVLMQGCATDLTRRQTTPRERISIDADWRFLKYASPDKADDLL